MSKMIALGRNVPLFAKNEVQDIHLWERVSSCLRWANIDPYPKRRILTGVIVESVEDCKTRMDD